MRIQIAVPEKHVSKPVLDAALEAVTRLNEQMIKAGDSPTSLQLLDAGAIWKPEPPGQEHFDHGARIAARGDGDCDDWAPLHAATLRVTGRDRGAIAEVRKSGPKRWHATTTLSSGREDDPSLKAGMPGPGNVGIRGAWVPSMRAGVHGVEGAYINTPQLAMRPIFSADDEPVIESWQARADLPWHWRPSPNSSNPADLAMVTLHRSPVSSTAICGAARGAFKLGLANGADPEQLKRLSALCELCEGAPWEDVAARYGAEHATAAGAIVGSFFGKAFKKLGKIAKGAVKLAAPLAKGALSFVPGGSLASSALSMATPELKKSLAKQKHAPPELRRPEAIIRPLAPEPVNLARAAAPVQQAAPQFLPYPYPLPYPVPGWGGGQETPGTAWPPR
jgi:hypothetical protein